MRINKRNPKWVHEHRHRRGQKVRTLSSIDVPRIKGFGDETYRQFRADVDHLFTQLLLDNSSRTKREAIFISSDLKTKIHTHLYHLRELIENADDLDEGKRQILLRRLADFEAELGKKRLSLTAIAVCVIIFLSAPGAAWASADAANKVLNHILRTVGEAKMVDDATPATVRAEDGYYRPEMRKPAVPPRSG